VTTRYVPFLPSGIEVRVVCEVHGPARIGAADNIGINANGLGRVDE